MVNVCAFVCSHERRVLLQISNNELSETERNADKRKAAPAEGRWDAWNPLVASSCLILTILKDITQLADNVSPSELGRKQWAKEEGGTKSE